jgi:hypothetical protein
MPLAIGGTNDQTNLQVLCQSCHKSKTEQERELGYTSSDAVYSSFNTQIKNIFESKLCGAYAFIETLNQDIPKKYVNSPIYSIDINKCRKNMLYYSNYEYPVFTVMDQVSPYIDQTEPGLYYIETESYLPLRGNGWYYYPMVEYCLEQKIIKSSDIKYCVISSLSIPPNYYNGFIDYLYSNIEEAKLSVNAMIGNFKPKVRENLISKCIVTSRNEAFNNFLSFKSATIDHREIAGKDYYQVYEKMNSLYRLHVQHLQT